MDSIPIRVVLIDDDPIQAQVICAYLTVNAGPGFELTVAVTLADGLARLAAATADVLLLDLSLPDSAGIDTLRRTQERLPALPIVVMTSTEDEGLGDELVRAGAQDYLVKGQISAQVLRRVLRYAIERKRLLRELQDALASIRTLRGLISICYNCKRIRTDRDTWQRLEEYLQEHTAAQLSHGLCEDCAYQLYPQYFKKPNAGAGPPPSA